MIGVRLRYALRKVAYSRPFEPILYRFFQRRAAPRPDAEADRWDRDLSGAYSSYLDDSLSVMSRARLTATLARDLLPGATKALDLGCGKGQLGEALRESGFNRYLGVDISPVAIQAAKKRLAEHRHKFPATCHFEARPLTEFAPDDPNKQSGFDLIVFSEVLYYLPSARDAALEVKRYAKWLTQDGLLCVALKDDAKSHAIIRQLSHSFEFTKSILFQESLGIPSHRTRIDRARPAYLVSMLTPRRPAI